MDSSKNQLPRVYLFKKDHDMIEELVRCRPAEETGGDLFGLWTSEDELVLHIVTGQGKEILQTSSKSSLKSYDTLSKAFQRLEELLHWKFHLNYMGKWQYMRRSKLNERALKRAFDQRPHYQRDTRLVLLTADYDTASKQVGAVPVPFPGFVKPGETQRKEKLLSFLGKKYSNWKITLKSSSMPY